MLVDEKVRELIRLTTSGDEILGTIRLLLEKSTNNLFIFSHRLCCHSALVIPRSTFTFIDANQARHSCSRRYRKQRHILGQ